VPTVDCQLALYNFPATGYTTTVALLPWPREYEEGTGRWAYRPRGTFALNGGDSLLATSAPEGLEPLAELFGQEVEELRE
jgi:hypothetical protein